MAEAPHIRDVGPGSSGLESGCHVRELAHRSGPGLEVRLFWCPLTDELTVSISEARSSTRLEIRPERGAALDAFYHPYAYIGAAAVAPGSRIECGDETDDARGVGGHATVARMRQVGGNTRRVRRRNPAAEASTAPEAEQEIDRATEFGSRLDAAPPALDQGFVAVTMLAVLIFVLVVLGTLVIWLGLTLLA